MNKSFETEEFKNSVSRKIGIKLLDSLQIQSVMPDFKELLKSICVQRERANSLKFHMNTGYHLMHDNIFGILGGRGSGKTSVLFSLREFLKKDNINDIILPIISPELINESCSMLSWVLSMLEDSINEIEQCLQKKPDILYQLQNRFKFKDCSKNFYRSILRQEYDEILQECGTLRGFQDIHQYEYEDMISLRAQHSQRQYRLMNRLSSFWETLAFIQQKITNSSQTPLIFIVFDDIDLAPERSMELLLSAYKYFSSPYVVIILTAAISTLRQVLTYRMYEKVVGSNFSSLIQGHDILGSDSINEHVDSYQMGRANEAALEYLNKVLPQTSRYELSRYDTYDRKILFRYPKKENDEPYNMYIENSIPLGKFILNCIQKNNLLRPNYGTGKPNRNFLACVNDETKLSRQYYLLFGDKNRYISNACLGIFNACEQLQEIREQMYNERVVNNQKYIREIYYVLRHLLTVLISSHTRNLEECTSWIPELFKYIYGTHFLFINYSFLLEKYKTYLHIAEEDVAHQLKNCKENMSKQSYELRYEDCFIEKHIQIKQKIGTLFIMLNFLEHLTSVLAPEYYSTIGQSGRTRSIHGLTQFLEFINEGALYNNSDNDLELFPYVDSMNEIIEFYGDILSEPARFLNFDIRNANHVANYFEYLRTHPKWLRMLSKKTSKNNKTPPLYLSCTRNPSWIRTVCSMLYLTKSGIQLFHEGVFSHYISFFNSISILPVLHKKKDILYKDIYIIMNSFNIKKLADSYLEKLFSDNNIKVKPKIDYKSINSWEELCEKAFEISNCEFLLYDFIKNIKNSHNERKNKNYILLLCSKIEQLLIKCHSKINQIPVIARFKFEEQADIIMNITAIMEAIPVVSHMGNSILQQIENATEDNGWIEVSSKNILNFFQMVSYQIATWQSLKDTTDDNIDNIAIGALYTSYLFDLIKILNFSYKDSDCNILIKFLDDVALLQTLAPYYICARFILINQQQYSEFRILGKEDKQYNSSKSIDFAGEIYQDLCESIFFQQNSNKTNPIGILSEIMFEIKNKYCKEYMRKFGVME